MPLIFVSNFNLFPHAPHNRISLIVWSQKPGYTSLVYDMILQIKRAIILVLEARSCMAWRIDRTPRQRRISHSKELFAYIIPEAIYYKEKINTTIHPVCRFQFSNTLTKLPVTKSTTEVFHTNKTEHNWQWQYNKLPRPRLSPQLIHFSILRNRIELAVTNNQMEIST